MKLPLHLIALSSAMQMAIPAIAWTSGASSFTGRRIPLASSSSARFMSKKNDMVMYESSHDPSSQGGERGGNMFQVLATTEQWLSDTLSSQGPNNPYARKEVTYVCETSGEGAMITASIFRRLKEAREEGELHGQVEEERLLDTDQVFTPRTLRETQVIVIPANEEYQNSFLKFNALIETINQARRNARDYVTDVSLEKLDDRMYGESERDWSVSVNCAHLHPKFGELTSQQKLQQMKEEDEAGEVDLNLQVYKQKRLLARRSPYPTVVIEVRSVPPPDFGDNAQGGKKEEETKVTSEDIQMLEALFGRSAALDHPTKEKSRKDEEDDFYNAIGKIGGLEEITLLTPMILAQNWIAAHDDKVDVTSSTFTATDAKHVDEGYEFVFTNLAMQVSQFESRGGNKSGMRQYLVMDKFLSSSATSFEKFAKEVKTISNCIPGVAGKVTVSTFHPEHVDPKRRSPSPIFVWKWK